ncbi:MAG: hypothetical protein ABFD10_22570 [Prolixibacteraceae bacterium]
MYRFIFFVFLGWGFLTAWAQEAETLPDCGCNSVDELIGQVFQSNIHEARVFLGPGSDPFGIQMSVRARVQAPGEAVPTAYTAFNLPALNEMAANLAREHRFDRYDLDGPGEGGIYGEIWKYNVGIVPREIIKNDSREFQVIAKNYTCNHSVNGQISKIIIETYVIVTGKKPDDGAIQAEVYAYDKDGNQQQWRNSTWGSGGHIYYVRVGPGNDSGNSKKGDDKPKQVDANVAMDPNYNPGYYYPKIKHRGCTQDFSVNPEEYKDLEVKLKLEGTPSWDDFVMVDGKAIAKNTLNAETRKAPVFQTWFSRGNTVTGTVYDPEGKPVKKGIKVHIEPQGWTLPQPVEPVETNDQGIYKFDHTIETGVYKVFTEDNPGGGEVIEVCNCPEKGERPNDLYDHVDINDQTDLTFLIECNETYTEDIEPLVLEGTTSPPGKVNRKTLGYSVVRIQSKVINDFFEETFINNVTGAPADDKNKVVSFSSEKYSFDPADEEGDGWQKAVAATSDYDGGANSAFIFPARKIDGKMKDSDLFLVDSIASVSQLQKKLQNKKWEMLLGPACIEGRGFDKEIIVQREARPVSLRELKQSKENKSAIRLVQELEYKQGYNTNFVGLGKFMDGKDLEGLEVLNKLIEDPALLYQAIGGIENMEKINPEMAGYMRENKGHKNMAVFMRSAYGLNKYSGMLESWASRVKMKREITLRPVSAAEADKYLTSGRAFEVTGAKDEPDIDPGQLKDVLKDLFKSK